MKDLLSVIIIIFAVSVFSCSEIPAGWDDMDLEDIAREIDKEVGTASADKVSHCKTIPIGAKPCGGPWGYLVFSERESNESKLSSLVTIYNDLDKERNKKERRFSTCDAASPPPLELKDGKCQGTSNYAWNPGDILRFNNLD